MSIPLPTRIGPKYGTFALTPEGEAMVAEAIKSGVPPTEVAFRVGISVTTVYAILRRGGIRKARASRSSTPETPSTTPQEKLASKRVEGAAKAQSTPVAGS